MKEITKRSAIYSPIFIGAVFVLLLNDFFLKEEFPGFITGKLSDFAGLFAVTVFFTALFPRFKIVIAVGVSVLFTLWKSEFSQAFIDFVNGFNLGRINRTIDYSDLVTISVIPLAVFYVKQVEWTNLSLPKLTKVGVIMISSFAFVATSFENDRHVWVSGNEILQCSRNDFDSALRSNKAVRDIDVLDSNSSSTARNAAKNIDSRHLAYFLYLDQNICSDNDIRLYIGLTDFGSSMKLESWSADVWCEHPLSKQEEELVKKIVETEVLNPLRSQLKNRTK